MTEFYKQLLMESITTRPALKAKLEVLQAEEK